MVVLVSESVGVRVQHVADDAMGVFHLGVGVVVVHRARRADDEALAPALDEGAEHFAHKLGPPLARLGSPRRTADTCRG